VVAAAGATEELLAPVRMNSCAPCWPGTGMGANSQNSHASWLYRMLDIMHDQSFATLSATAAHRMSKRQAHIATLMPVPTDCGRHGGGKPRLLPAVTQVSDHACVVQQHCSMRASLQHACRTQNVRDAAQRCESANAKNAARRANDTARAR
jgi:hypothetical protein